MVLFSIWGKHQASSKNLGFFQAWWCMPVVSAHRRLREEDLEFEASLGYIVYLSKHKTPSPPQQ
jgi:hypothetical protein